MGRSRVVVAVVVLIGAATAAASVAIGGSGADVVRSEVGGAGSDDIGGVGAAASDPVVAGPPTLIDHRLLVVGDSVMQGAAPELVDRLEGWEVVSDTRVGRFLEEGIRVARRRRGELGAVVVVGLGNNYGGDEAAFADEVDRMLTTLADAEHVLWLTVAEFRDDRHEVNAVLRAAARRDHRVRLVDWNRVWRSDPALTAADRLHLTPAGAERMAALVARDLDELLTDINSRPAPGAGRPRLSTSGSLPPGADGAVGGDRPKSRPVRTTTTVAVEAPRGDLGDDPVVEEAPVVADTTPTPTSAPVASTQPEPTVAPTTAPEPVPPGAG